MQRPPSMPNSDDKSKLFAQETDAMVSLTKNGVHCRERVYTCHPALGALLV